MPRNKRRRYGSGSRYRRRSTKANRVRGYTLRGRGGRINYIGISNNPGRRAAQHRRAGKRGRMRVETRPLT